MTVRLIGAACSNGTDCNPGHPPRPVYLEGRCWWCWASGRVVEHIRDAACECCLCGGDPRGGEVQPVFGAGQENTAATGHASLPEPLLFCVQCAAEMRARRAAHEGTESLDSLELWWVLDAVEPRPNTGEAAA